LLDGVISSRKQFGIFGVNLIKTFLIDFFAFHLASKIVLESDEQIIYTSKTFAIPKRKISSLFTGFDEERFNKIDFTEIPVLNEVNEQFHILFRGGNQVESGLELLKNSLRENVLPSNIRLTILSKGLENGGFGYSATVISKEISDRELFCVFLACNLVLGQMSGHERLDRTIPHKFFEAAFFGKAYLTAPFGPMKNFVDKQIVQYFDPTEVDGLFTKIVALSGDVDGMESLGDRFRGWYESNASSEILGKKFLAISRSI
jgi:hypothetical protein